MSVFTLDDVRRILVQVAGQDDGVRIDGGIGDVPFDEMGYDSLARLELAARIASEYGLELDDERSASVETPNELVELVRHAASVSNTAGGPT